MRPHSLGTFACRLPKKDVLWGAQAGEEALRDRAGEVGVGARIARGACEVVRRMDSPPALAAALAAVVGGDLVLAPPAGANGDEGAAALLPLYPPGAPNPLLLPR